MTDDSAAIMHCRIPVVDGVELEAELVAPPTPRLVAAVAHPHPQFGGDLRNNVVAAMFRAAPRAGAAALRFNFRGVGTSTGHHGGGVGERDDLLAALDHLAASFPGTPLVIAGYSFGAEVALTVAHDRAAGWFAVAPVFRLFPPEAMVAAADTRPKQLVVAEHDQYAPPAGVRETTRGWRNTATDIIAMADHFFLGGTNRVGACFETYLGRLTAAQ